MYEVPTIILQQLGGRKFLAMTGANSLCGDKQSLSFMLPRARHFVKEGINAVRITLTPMDTYTIEYRKVSLRYGAIEISRDEAVYAEDLQRIFTATTGLATHL